MEGNEVEEKIVGDLDWDGLHRPRIYYAVATTLWIVSFGTRRFDM